jgi:predicted nucleotidyltransferase
MSLVLEQLANDVGVHERTLRRAVGGGLIHAQRPSSRQLSLSEQEMVWVRSHWPLVSRLLAAVRTEPNVALAVLFGSVARGTNVDGASDVDLLIELRHPSPGALEALRRRLDERLQPDVQLVPLQAARRDPHLLAEVLRDGRPLVDRGHVWPRLQTQREVAQAQADQAGRKLHEEARAAVGYFQRLAAERTPLSAGAAR